MNSRSRLGRVATCIACKEKTHYYVAVLKNYGGSTAPHWFVCFNCYQQDKWQQAVDDKAYKKSIQPRKPRTYKRKPTIKPTKNVWDKTLPTKKEPIKW